MFVCVLAEMGPGAELETHARVLRRFGTAVI